MEVSHDRILNDGLIAEDMEEIRRMIIDLIGGIGKYVFMDQWSWPQVADSISLKELHQLFTHGLGLEEARLCFLEIENGHKTILQSTPGCSLVWGYTGTFLMLHGHISQS